MKAVILAGGEGTRLRPLTLTAPKPVVPVVDRPFLRHQLDLLARVGVTEIVFSVAYQPERIEAVFGDGGALGRRIHYAVEETPLGTGGAVKNAAALLDDTTIVFNGDVLTDVDLPAVVRGTASRGAARHPRADPGPQPRRLRPGGDRRRRPGPALHREARARPRSRPTPSTPASTSSRRPTLELMPAGRQPLDRARLLPRPPRARRPRRRLRPPRLLDRHRHAREVPAGPPRHPGRPLPGARSTGSPRTAAASTRRRRVEDGARAGGPFYVGPGCGSRPGARVGPGAVLTAGVTVAPARAVARLRLWEGTQVGEGADVRGRAPRRGVRVGARAAVGPGAVLGEGTSISRPFSRTA